MVNHPQRRLITLLFRQSRSANIQPCRQSQCLHGFTSLLAGIREGPGITAAIRPRLGPRLSPSGLVTPLLPYFFTSFSRSCS